MTESDWNDARQALFVEMGKLHAAIETASPADLLERQGRNRRLFAEVLCRLIHSTCHTGQIAKTCEILDTILAASEHMQHRNDRSGACSAGTL